ncbi:diguanylate cyclase [Massilia sp. MS-15]|uniref:GGDEF domain-containing protein n=1 Tax=Massilia sp. MS-15 TaxID=2878200 RepID=UPI001CD21E28|nr:sensor domain-containing diguanylate cyclase [Massilia sp. MS-15]MCA1248216.1 sensor domain-containing diguanylate cyclase [Massilia sp. MS-15]
MHGSAEAGSSACAYERPALAGGTGLLGSQLAARRRNIRAGAFGILAVAVLALLLTYGWNSWQLRRLQLSGAEISTVNLTHALADQASSAFKMVDTVLVGLVNRVEQDGLAASDKDAVYALMKDHLAELPALQGLFIYDRAGNWIVNSAGRSYNGRNNADRAYFRHHRDFPDRGVHIGAPIIGRTSGAWVIPVSRRLQDADGRFSGVVLATIKIDFFRRIYEKIALRPGGKLILTLKDGTQLLAIPFSRTDIGARLRDTPLFSELAARLPEGGLVETSSRRQDLIHAVRQAGDYPVLLAVARSKDHVLAPWRESVLAAGTALFALAACLGAMGIYLVRQMHERDGLEHQLMGAKTTLESLNASLLTQSQNDPLTGLFNRRYVEAALEREVAQAQRDGGLLAALMIDVDHFKQYNDRYGHLAGDATLIEVARTVRRGACRPRDVAGRFGGEEFVVLLPATDLAGAAVVAETIRADLQRRGVAHRDAPGGMLSLSIGVACIAPVHCPDAANTLLDRADGALYAAKANGRNRVDCDDRRGADSLAPRRPSTHASDPGNFDLGQ